MVQNQDIEQVDSGNRYFGFNTFGFPMRKNSTIGFPTKKWWVEEILNFSNLRYYLRSSEKLEFTVVATVSVLVPDLLRSI